MPNIRPQDRRRTRRLKIGQPLKLRPSDPRIENFVDIRTTKNVSRDGLYFITRLDSYHEGMRLFVTLPFHSPADPGDREYIGQVLRIERLDSSERGIAVQLLSSSNSGIAQ